MIFDDADTSGFEPDARLTAMWLWTLSTSPSSEGNGKKDADEKATTGVTYSLEYDAARKIAQGLGAHLEELANLVVVKGDTGRLLSLSERAASLFDKAEQVPTTRAARRSAKQIGLFAEVEAAEEREAWGELGAPATGETTLDRVHQAMILFGAGRSDALKRFLVEEGVGREPRFWKLAQALSALYPAGSEEKRWVDGVHARKKSLGFG